MTVNCDPLFREFEAFTTIHQSISIILFRSLRETAIAPTRKAPLPFGTFPTGLTHRSSRAGTPWIPRRSLFSRRSRQSVEAVQSGVPRHARRSGRSDRPRLSPQLDEFGHGDSGWQTWRASITFDTRQTVETILPFGSDFPFIAFRSEASRFAFAAVQAHGTRYSVSAGRPDYASGVTFTTSAARLARLALRPGRTRAATGIDLSFASAMMFLVLMRRMRMNV